MPGILPMKVIKVGTTAQSRIAQACDRCRSKKIRCDGITPCCTQCANVGFECKTSDKLSRRAFPRGYTESLEERVRSLEGEVKELKDLLDEKDEKIDILSKIHSNSPSLRWPSSTASTSSIAGGSGGESSSQKEDTFRIQQSSNPANSEDTDSSIMGASSGRQFVDTFKIKCQESGKHCDDLKSGSFFAVQKKDRAAPGERITPSSLTIPPRIFSDQLINVFFQEWAPLFPILHRPTFLDIYEKYVADPESIEDRHAIVQLHLILGISSFSAEGNKNSAPALEPEWKATMELIKEDETLQTLQCFALAQIYTMIKADYLELRYYRGMAISLCQRLGLHQSQSGKSLGVLASETRKKVFWTLYTLDCFSAAILGLPKLLNEFEIQAAYPADVDDENVSENGFQPSLPGESTRLSSALALFRGARVMSKVLDEVYPSDLSHDISLKRLCELNNELDEWSNRLPGHLRLKFAQDKPSTNVCGSRSPILSLVFHYIRTLIHRPAVGSSLGHKADTSVVALAQSSKHIVQIIQLLKERRMSFSICLNRDEVLLLAGFGLLYQTLEIDHKGRLIQDSHRQLCSITSILERGGAAGASEFKKITCAMISADPSPMGGRAAEATDPPKKSNGTMSPPKKRSVKSSRRRPTIASSPTVKQEVLSVRRSPAHSLPLAAWPQHACNKGLKTPPSLLPRSGAPNRQPKPHVAADDSSQLLDSDLPNLDYLDFSKDRSSISEYTPVVPERNATTASHDGLLECDIISQSGTPFDNIFSSPDLFTSTLSPSSAVDTDWVSDLWTVPPDGHVPTSASVVSFSEEELTSGEELSSCDTNGTYAGIKIPQEGPPLGLDELDGSFVF